MLIISGFKTEYQINPIGVTCKKPEFCWNFEATETLQDAYHIIVSDTLNNAEKNVGDKWDSGIVKSSSVTSVDYEGEKLASAETYYVKLIVYGSDGEISEKTSSFETGLIDDSEWKGNWMSMPVNNQGGTSLYRKKITLQDKTVVKARAYVCGIGYHELYVNGKKAGTAVLNPGVTDFSKRLPYSTYDIYPSLNKGDNVLGIEVGHGWLGAKKVLAQFNFYYEDGSTEEYHSSTNGGWWVSGSPTVDNSVYGGERYDARLEDKWPKNWATVNFEPTWENGWMFTIFSPAPGGKLEPELIEPVEICDKVNPVSVTAKDNILIADLGVNIAGWARIKVRGERGSVVTLKFGERLDKNGCVNRVNLRSAAATDVYILKGIGIEEFAPRFTYHGFQYIEIGTEGKCEILSVTGEHVHTNVKIKGKFECSDGVINKLHEIALRTELNNEQGILTDCPQRDERFGWLNDLGSRLYQTVYNCGMERFFPKFTKDIADTQLSGGEIGDTAPFFTGGIPADPVCIAYLLMPYFSYKYYGDRKLVIETYDGNKKWVDFLLSHSKNYIMDYSYYADWVAPACFNEHTDNIYVSSVYLYWHLKLLSELAGIAGKEDDKKYYSEKADASVTALNEKYFDKKTCNYESGTQAANSLALSLEIVPEEYKKRVAENIYNNVLKFNHHSTCGNVGYRHLFYCLCDYGHIDEALNILANPEYPGWGYMLKNGATSVWERWESEMSNEMDSFDHPMFASYDAVFYRYLGGICIDDKACGADKVSINPQIAENIDYVNCSFETVRGKIVSNWKKVNGKVNYRIEIPAMTTAEITVGGKTYSVGCGVYDYEI